MRIRTRVIGATLAAVAIVCVVFLAYMLRKESEDAHESLQANIERTHQQVKVVIPGPLYDGNVEQLNAYLDSVFRDPDLLELSLTEYRGGIELSRRRAPPAAIGRTLEGKVVIPRGIDELGEVRTVYSTANIELRLTESRNEILLFSAVLMFAVGIVLFLVARGFTRPVERLTEAAGAMAGGDLNREIDARGAEEFVVLGNSFVRMRDAIREKIADLDDNNRKLNEEIAQRRGAEQERDRLVSILEATTDLVSMADPGGNVLYVNRAGRAMAGFGNRPLADLRIPDFHPAWATETIVRQGIPAAIREGSWSGETALLGPGGREIPVSQIILSHRDAQGSLSYLSTVMRDISERQEARRRLEARDALLRRLSERVPGVIYQYRMYPDGHSCFPYASEGIREIYEVTPEQVRDDATLLIGRLHPEDLDAVLESIKRSFDDLAPWRHEYRVVLPQRGGRWLRGESVPERLDDGSVLWHGYIADVTESRRAEEALRTKDSAIAASINGIAFANLAGNLTYVNRAFLQMWGYDREEEVVGRSALEFWRRPDEAAVALDAVMTGNSWSGELTALRRDGSVFVALLSAVVIPGAEGGPDQLMGSFIDVTERRKAEEKLRTSEALLVEAQEVAHLGNWSLDFATGTAVWSDEEYRLLGYEPGGVEASVDSFMAAVHPGDVEPVRAAMQRAMNSRERAPYRIEHKVTTPRGEHIVEERGRVSFDSDGTAIRMFGTTMDVTERRRADEELRRLNEELEARVQERTRSLEQTLQELRSAQEDLVRTEKLASLGSMVAGIAHELNTPIGNCVTVASALSDRAGEFRGQISDGTVRRSALEGFLGAAGASADMLLQNALRAATLVQSFKQVAVDQTSELRRRFDLRETVAEVIATMTPALKGKRVSFDVRVPDGIDLDSYPGPFGQVLMNLIRNAVIHGFEDRGEGHIRIAASVEEENWIELAFADDGKGIAADHLDRIFDPFFTTRFGQGGSGLGLHIVHNLVTGVLGGRIAVCSAPGEGTEFRLRLPRVAPERAAGDGHPQA